MSGLSGRSGKDPDWDLPLGSPTQRGRESGLGCVIVVASQGHLKEHGGLGIRMKESMMEGKRFTVN
mgnify:CR=1 FL=1